MPHDRALAELGLAEVISDSGERAALRARAIATLERLGATRDAARAEGS
jgi:hypothetical protein